MPTGRIVVVAPKARRSRKPSPAKPAPACGPVVRIIRGKAVVPPRPADFDDKARAEAAERLLDDLRRAARGE
jgi:hypothetical protein